MTLYAGAAIAIYKKSSFLSLYSFLVKFSE